MVLLHVPQQRRVQLRGRDVLQPERVPTSPNNLGLYVRREWPTARPAAGAQPARRLVGQPDPADVADEPEEQVRGHVGPAVPLPRARTASTRLTSPEAASDRRFPAQQLLHAEWWSPLTSKMLIEFVALHRTERWGNMDLRPTGDGGSLDVTPAQYALYPSMIGVTQTNGTVGVPNGLARSTGQPGRSTTTGCRTTRTGGRCRTSPARTPSRSAARMRLATRRATTLPHRRSTR